MFYPYVGKIQDEHTFVFNVYSADAASTNQLKEYILSRLKYNICDGTFTLCNDYTFGMTGQNISISRKKLQEIFDLNPGSTIMLTGIHRIYRDPNGSLYMWAQLNAVSIKECEANMMLFCSPIEEEALKKRTQEIMDEHDNRQSSELASYL